MRGGTLHGLGDLFEAAHERSERIAERDVIGSRPEGREGLVVPLREGVQRQVLLPMT